MRWILGREAKQFHLFIYFLVIVVAISLTSFLILGNRCLRCDVIFGLGRYCFSALELCWLFLWIYVLGTAGVCVRVVFGEQIGFLWLG